MTQRSLLRIQVSIPQEPHSSSLPLFFSTKETIYLSTVCPIILRVRLSASILYEFRCLIAPPQPLEAHLLSSLLELLAIIFLRLEGRLGLLANLLRELVQFFLIFALLSSWYLTYDCLECLHELIELHYWKDEFLGDVPWRLLTFSLELCSKVPPFPSKLLLRCY